ncbi:MAG: hypothetical protein Q8L87_19705 [Anaerolineales bacterium]|nr:hypothetical protein [Anaerolineales bacterium]
MQWHSTDSETDAELSAVLITINHYITIRSRAITPLITGGSVAAILVDFLVIAAAPLLSGTS